MGRIRALSTDLINQIAAGEVIESPHSVLKELIENSLDAGATEIAVETKAGGLEKILVRDNGHGILREDLPLVVERHATSKIRDLQDLHSILSFGFRGEAVASIASVSKMRLESGTEGERFAYRILVENGKIQSETEIPPVTGTLIEIGDLFYNTPVRRKFLKSEMAEDKKNKTRVQVSALTRPDVGFRFVQNDKEVYRMSPNDLKERIIALFGENLRDHLIPVTNERNGWKVEGYISDPDFYRSNRMGQFFFVNGRPIDIKNASFLLKKSYDELLPPGAHPWCFLYFSVSPDRVDVNVHPQKKEIRFLEEEFFTGFFLSSLNQVLRSSTPVSFLELKRRLSRPGSGLSSYSSSVSSSPSFSGSTRSLQTGTLRNDDTGGSGETGETGGPLFQDILHRNIFPEAGKREGFSLDQVGPGIRLGDLTDEPRKHPEFLPKRHFGTIFETFLLAEAEDGLYIIDQHTAHERIRYEEVVNRLKKGSFGIQPLLTPIRLDFSREEAQEIMERSDELESLGIRVEEFGEGSLIVREVPAYLEAGTEKEVILDYLENVLLLGKALSEPFEEMAKMVACRSSLRKGSQVSDTILAELLNRLSYTENPARCPHGRPTLVKLTRDDLEKMFHRK